ncbi:MAG: exodeoxyribonuclease V subunit alpha [Burkholderiaceae bacterium]
MTTTLDPEGALARAFAARVESWLADSTLDWVDRAAVVAAAEAVARATAAGHVCLDLDEIDAASAASAASDADDVADDDSALDSTGDDLGDGDHARGNPRRKARFDDKRNARRSVLRAALERSGIVGRTAPAARASRTAPGGGARGPEGPDLGLADDNAGHGEPLVLDEANRLYLRRYFDYEQRLARRLVVAMTPPAFAVPEASTKLLDTSFARNAARLGDRVDHQRRAAALALRSRLAVISGGPGTGKTTTVVNLLACLMAGEEALRIALAAPTGKAAARMMEAIHEHARHLPPAIRERMPATATTIHRLLGAGSRGQAFGHHAGRRLAIDVLVVDEASMLDLALATHLLEAVPDGARIVLIGDKDQLAAVESGAVFAELAARTAPPPLSDHVVWLVDSFRFGSESAIGRLATAINGGDVSSALALLRDPPDPGIVWLADPDPVDEAFEAPAAPDPALRAAADGFDDYLEALRSAIHDRHRVRQAFERFRILCALRQGPRGVATFNDWMTRVARGVVGAPSRDDRQPGWFPGRPVMILANDYALGRFNGDVGIALPDDHGRLRVWFADDERPIDVARLPRHQTAFAMTVHQSQGSEFEHALVVLPRRASRVISRELLYTAVTRARDRITIAAPPAVLATAIGSPTRRHSGLQARLAEAVSVRNPGEASVRSNKSRARR